jgi:uncharacterized cupin superfamily protein
VTEISRPVAVRAAEAATRPSVLTYPAPLAARFVGRSRQPLGDLFGLTHFGVNLARLAPGAASALRHHHSRQDEFIYILEGTPVLVTDAGETALSPGMCAGFPAGSGDGHHLINRSEVDVVYLEIGDRTAGDVVTYPDDDIALLSDADGRRRVTRKDGTPI